MTRHLPPLSALRAFEAACRLRSYSAAAGELSITQGAVSQQIRKLEEALGARLFTRAGSRMTPTADAEALAAQVREALQILHDGLSDFTGAAPTLLTLSVLPSFARLWLGPRLAAMNARWPEVRFDIRSDRQLANFAAGEVDMGVRVGDGNWPGLEMVHLGDPVAFPVCAPEARARLLPDGEGDLRRAVLLEPGDPMWARWTAPDGRRPRGRLGSTIFDDASLVIDAALDGAGVALIRSIMAERLLRAGRLVRLQAPSAAPGRGYFAVWPRRSRKHRLITEVAAWLRDEMKASIHAAESLAPPSPPPPATEEWA